MLGKAWRAMILKDNEGDVAIALAVWEGYRAGVPGVSGSVGVKGKNIQTLLLYWLIHVMAQTNPF
jgi:hypothetical protein